MMTYETPEVQEIGNADELTLGCACCSSCDCEGYSKADIQF